MFGWDTDDYRDREQEAAARLRQAHPDIGGVNVACRAGWIPLVDDLLTEMEAALPAGHRIVFVSAGEKLAALRFRWRIEPPLGRDASALFDAAEERAWRRSVRTCEVCGGPGRVLRYPSGWFVARCEAHAEGAKPWEEK